MLIYGKDMHWPDNFLSRLFWETDIGELKSCIEFNPSGLGLAMRHFDEVERTIFNAYFRNEHSFKHISIFITPYRSEDEVRGILDRALRKLHHPKNFKRFIKIK